MARRFDSLTHRDLAFRKPFPYGWVPAIGERVYVSAYLTARFLFVQTATVYKRTGGIIHVAYLPADLNMRDWRLRFAKMPAGMLRPAPQVLTYTQQLTAIRDMLELSQAQGLKVPYRIPRIPETTDHPDSY